MNIASGMVYRFRPAKFLGASGSGPSTTRKKLSPLEQAEAERAVLVQMFPGCTVKGAPGYTRYKDLKKEIQRLRRNAT